MGLQKQLKLFLWKKKISNIIIQLQTTQTQVFGNELDVKV